MYTNKFVCVTGVVQSDSTVRESVSEGFGDSFSKDDNLLCFFYFIKLLLTYLSTYLQSYLQL